MEKARREHRKTGGQEITVCEETQTELGARKERAAQKKGYKLLRLQNGLSCLLFSGGRRGSEGLCCSKKALG